MGMEQLELTDFHFVDFSAGLFSNKNRRDAPGSYYTSRQRPDDLRNGFYDVQHCIWYEGGLRQFFGYTAVHTTAGNANAAGLGVGSADWGDGTERTQFTVYGNKFYEISSAGALTDRTGAVALNTTRPYEIRTHIMGTNQFVIGGNGAGTMWKWTGTGASIAALGGTPHKYKSFDYYGERWWGVRPDADKYNYLYGSDFTDPESNWNDSGQIFPFQDSLTGCVSVEDWLAVVGEKSISSLEGFGQTSFRKTEGILDIGTTAHRTLRKGQLFDYQYGWIDGFFMVSWQGPVFISTARRIYKLGLGMYEGWNKTTGLNKGYLSTACGCFLPQFKLYVFAVPWGANTEPTRLFAIDCARPIMARGWNQITYPIWPCPTILGSSYKVRDLRNIRDTSADEWLYMQDDNGFMYKFDPAEKNYYPANSKTAIEAHGQSKIFDLGATYEMREPQMMAEALGDYDVSTFFNFDHGSGAGTYDDINTQGDDDVLTTSFTLGSSTLGGTSYVWEYMDDVTGWGQLMQFKFQNYTADQSFNIEELILWMKFIRQGSLRV